MYYESIEHTEKEVANATEAAKMIKSGQALAYEALVWENQNGKFYAVDDVVNGNAFGETAIIMAKNGKFFQIESITAAWIDTPEELAKYFQQAETQPFSLSETQLIIGKAKGDETGRFDCACCGENFIGNVQYQKQFDQDAGFGICKSCEKY